MRAYSKQFRIEDRINLCSKVIDISRDPDGGHVVSYIRRQPGSKGEWETRQRVTYNFLNPYAEFLCRSESNPSQIYSLMYRFACQTVNSRHPRYPPRLGTIPEIRPKAENGCVSCCFSFSRVQITFPACPTAPFDTWYW